MGECLILRSGGVSMEDATATNDTILQGYTAYVNDELIAGSIPIYPNFNGVIEFGDQFIKNKGYCTGNILVHAPSLSQYTDGTADSNHILDGKTAWVNGSLITGQIALYNLENTVSLLCGGSYTIPAGYHNGSESISARSLSDQTEGTAKADYIYTECIAWVAGSKVTGTMPDNGAVSKALSANGTYTIPKGYHNGKGSVTQSLTTQAAATITPGTSNKTACAVSRWTTGAVTVAGASTLVAGNIKKGVTIFGVTGNWQGY